MHASYGAHKKSLKQALAVLAIALSACRAAPEKKTVLTIPATEEEALRYAEQFIDAVEKPNVARASMMVDWDGIFERATAGTSVSPQLRAAFVRGARSTTQTSAYVRHLVNVAEQGGKISLLRIRGNYGERRVILRVLPADGGVNYNELILTRDAAGFVRASDIYAYANGEFFSDTVRGMFLSTLNAEPNLIERLLGRNSEMVETAGYYRELTEKSLAGKNEEVVDLVKRLPPRLRKERQVLVMYVSASSRLDAGQYQSALDEMRATYPNEPGLDLMLIDGYYVMKKYDDALDAIDRLDRAVEGDPYLDTWRASIFLQKGDVDEALRFAGQAERREPALVTYTESIRSAALERKQQQ